MRVQSREGGGSIYTQRAVYFPRGLAGRLYWYSILPFHGFIFPGMANRITQTASAEVGRAGADESVATPATPANPSTADEVA